MSYCTSCYRELPSGETRCARCAQTDDARPFSRPALLLGVIGIVILIGGMFTLDVRACLTGAAIAALALLMQLKRALTDN